RDGRGGDGIVGPVVLADAEDVEPDRVGELDLLDELAQPLSRIRAWREVGEAGDAELHAREATRYGCAGAVGSAGAPSGSISRSCHQPRSRQAPALKPIAG